MVVLMLAALFVATPAAADEVRPLVGVRVEGDTKVTDTTALRLARVAIGDPVSDALESSIEAALLSSELFKKVNAHLEEVEGGYLLVVKLDDKLSWIVAPTLYLLPSSYSIGAAYVANNLFGEEKKAILYGQYGNKASLFFGTYLDPAYHGTKLQLRLDVYVTRHAINEYANPANDATDYTIARSTDWNFLDLGLLAGWRHFWWLISDIRFKPSYSFFTNVVSDDPTLRTKPERDGWDVSVQGRITLDRRRHRYGVTWGPYLQLITDIAIPGLDDYGYQVLAARAYQSFRFFEEHQLEFRVSSGIGRHLPIHEELTIGGVTDLRGYTADQFRGDTRLTARVEYSVPIAKWRTFAFRALGFYDVGYLASNFRDPDTRQYLPDQPSGSSWTRSDIGGGFRIYVGSVVLPLLGLDYAYGLEGKRSEVVFEVGLTDF